MHRVSDQRKHPRYEGSLLWARVKVDGELCEANLENVSLGGALINMRWACAPGKSVLLELRGAQRDLRLTGRVVATVPKGRGRLRPGARIKFNPTSPRSTDQLMTMIRGLPADRPARRRETPLSAVSQRGAGPPGELDARPTDPEAFQLHELKPMAAADDFDIDVELDQTRRPLKSTEEPTVRLEP